MQLFVCQCGLGEDSVADLPFHWKPSCNRKNSLNAGSSFSSRNLLGDVCCLSDSADDFLLCGDPGFAFERHICARSPSICRSPFRILLLSRDDMLSNESDRSDSISTRISFFPPKPRYFRISRSPFRCASAKTPPLMPRWHSNSRDLDLKPPWLDFAKHASSASNLPSESKQRYAIGRARVGDSLSPARPFRNLVSLP